MTDQIQDYFILNGNTGYIIVNSKGEFPKPSDLGMIVKAPFTACYKGYMYMLSTDKNDQLILHTLFANSDANPAINGVYPVEIPKDLHDLKSSLPFIPPRNNITASYKFERVITTPDTFSLFIHHFPQIYTGINLQINYSGKILLLMQIPRGYHEFLDTYRNMTGNKKEIKDIPRLPRDQTLQIMGILEGYGLLTDEIEEIFSKNPELDSESAEKIVSYFKYDPYILLTFETGKLIDTEILNQEKFNSERNKIWQTY